MADERGQQENQGQIHENNNIGLMDDQQQDVSRMGDSAGERSQNNERGQRKGTSNRGFAAMDPDRQKRIASEGGRAAHKQGVAHEWNRDEAREAGRKGGQIVSQNREHMSEIGRKGGQRSGSRRSQRTENSSSE